MKIHLYIYIIIGEAISPYLGVVGLSAGGYMIYFDMISNPIFYLLMLSGAYSTSMRLFGWDNNDNKEYYNIPKSKQMFVLTSYLTLIASLIIAMKENDKYRMTPKQLEALKNKDNNDDIWNIGLINPNEQQHKDGVYDDYFSDYFKEESMDQNNKKL